MTFFTGSKHPNRVSQDVDPTLRVWGSVLLSSRIWSGLVRDERLIPIIMYTNHPLIVPRPLLLNCLHLTFLQKVHPVCVKDFCSVDFLPTGRRNDPGYGTSLTRRTVEDEFV